MSKTIKLQTIVSNLTLSERAYEILLKAILEMNIYHKDANLRLDERALSSQLGISRTPIREALMRLQKEGFVEILSRRGVFIRRKSLEEILEMIIVWAGLESMAAVLVTERASDEELYALRAFAAQYSTTADGGADLEEYSDANIKFHQRIIELSQCHQLKQLGDGLFLHMGAVRRRAMGENNRRQYSVVDHMGIIEALEARDADLAARRVREHSMRLHDHVARSWSWIENKGQAEPRKFAG